MPFPEFKGEVFLRGQSGYEDRRYQYALSSEYQSGGMQPFAIIYPADESDIIKAIQYATENGLAIATRTGGHQYSGASSTAGDNIQLDMNEIFRKFEYDPATRTIRVGVSLSLKEFDDRLEELSKDPLRPEKFFVPHGQCAHVHIGGHMQTGGFGSFTRSFGLFADTIVGIELIDAKCQPRSLKRGQGSQDDQDLFFAVLGGSPGNFGVLTHLTIKPYDDIPDARGLKLIARYTKANFEALTDILVEMAEDRGFSKDYDLCITMLSFASNIVGPLAKGIDAQMEREHPELYYGDNWTEPSDWPTNIIVFASWTNRGNSTYDPAWFARIKHAAGPIKLVFRDDSQPVALSVLDKEFAFPIVREFRLPYEKRAYLTDSRSLSADGWSSWLAQRVDDLETEWNGCRLSVQLFNWGGDHSQLPGLDDGVTAFSWRDSTICCIMDCFYNEDAWLVPQSPWQTAREWQDRNDREGLGPQGKFCKKDRRVFWGSYGSKDMGQVYRHYHETQAKYDRLCAIKQKVDPAGVFTPNRFCVGVPPAPVAPMQPLGLVVPTAPSVPLPVSPGFALTTPPGVKAVPADELAPRLGSYDDIMVSRLLQRHEESRESP